MMSLFIQSCKFFFCNCFSEQRGVVLNLSHTSTNRAEITSKDFGALKLKFAEAISSDVLYQDKLDQTNDIEDFKLHQIQLKTKEFNEKLRKNPRDEKLWLEFVDFQDQVNVSTDLTGSIYK